MTFKGLSGEIQFDQQGNRENFELNVLELVSDGLKRVALWNSGKSNGLQIFREQSDIMTNELDIFKGKVLRILTVDEVRNFNHQELKFSELIIQNITIVSLCFAYRTLHTP